MTNREYLTWRAYFELELNYPSRTDFYLMQIAQEVFNTHHEKSLPLSEFKIQLGVKGSKPSRPKMTREQAALQSKRVWAARLGITTEEQWQSKLKDS